MKKDKRLILGPSSNGKSSAASEQRILKDLEKQQEKGHSIQQIYVDPPNGDEENEGK